MSHSITSQVYRTVGLPRSVLARPITSTIHVTQYNHKNKLLGRDSVAMRICAGRVAANDWKAKKRHTVGSTDTAHEHGYEDNYITTQSCNQENQCPDGRSLNWPAHDLPFYIAVLVPTTLSVKFAGLASVRRPDSSCQCIHTSRRSRGQHTYQRGKLTTISTTPDTLHDLGCLGGQSDESFSSRNSGRGGCVPVVVCEVGVSM